MIQKNVKFIFFMVLLVSSLMVTGLALAQRNDPSTGKILVANRGAGTVSVIDVASDQVVETIELPAADNAPDPMYVIYEQESQRVYVGDRANHRVVVFKAKDFSVEGVVSTGQGVWHMWAHHKNKQLWVNNDVDKTTTVIDTKSLQVITAIPMPADLVEQGGKPHDIILDDGAAYITLLGLSGSNDYVIKFDRSTFQEVARTPVGKDPHVILTEKNDKLYVASQNSNIVQVLQRSDLAEIASIEVPGAHGVWIPKGSHVLYVTNLPNGGTDGLFTIDLTSNTVIGEPVDTAFPTPHNLVATQDGRKLYLTHSGGNADKVTVYAISDKEPLPVPLGQITVGLNPFGLTFMPK